MVGVVDAWHLERVGRAFIVELPDVPDVTDSADV
jgi:hypothetical protein